MEDLLRELAPQVLAALTRRYGHFDLAEEAVQEALLAAATQWPDQGLPDNPPGWITTVATRRMTESSTRATPPPQESRCTAASCATRQSDWPGWSTGSCPMSLR